MSFCEAYGLYMVYMSRVCEYFARLIAYGMSQMYEFFARLRAYGMSRVYEFLRGLWLGV